MSLQRRLTVLFGALLVVGASARPGFNETNSIDENDCSTAVVTKNDEDIAAAASVEHKSEALSVPSVPVNERFPHAVLFGGTCGGSIISPKWIITAAHCTLFTSGRYVLAGTNNSDDGSGTSVAVNRLVVHPRFAVGPYWLNADSYDIKQVGARWDYLLVELREPLHLDNKTIAAVKLSDGPVPAGLDVGYAGYGAENHGETMRSEMHGMELVTQPDEVCSKLEQYDPLDMLCARGRPPRLDSACNGDSGSGLVANGKLLGIASWVEDDAHECRNGALVVFSRISLVRDWIKKVTGV